VALRVTLTVNSFVSCSRPGTCRPGRQGIGHLHEASDFTRTCFGEGKLAISAEEGVVHSLAKMERGTGTGLFIWEGLWPRAVTKGERNLPISDRSSALLLAGGSKADLLVTEVLQW
jgi:hypothetical protein